jgi:hypothetical protein
MADFCRMDFTLTVSDFVAPASRRLSLQQG